jgi:starvation-inducible DNA-binding protein
MIMEIGITAANRSAVASELAKLLADETILYLKTKNAHWNIEGADFYEKHKFFEWQFAQLDEIIDSVAERMRAIGHYAPSNLKQYLSLTNLMDKSDDLNDSEKYIGELLSDHEKVFLFLRERIKLFADELHDIGSSDFITGLMKKHEKMAWFLRSHLK